MEQKGIDTFLKCPEMSQSVQEIFLRVQEMRFAFGNNENDHFANQVKDYISVRLFVFFWNLTKILHIPLHRYFVEK